MAKAQGKDKGGPPRLDLNAAWARAVMLMRENLQLLAVIAGVFILLPNVMVYLALPPAAQLQGPMNVLADPTSSEAAIERASLAVAAAMQPVIGWVALVSALQHVGYGAMLALLGPARPTVGQAIWAGIKAILPLILAVIAFLLVWILAVFLVQLALFPLGVAAATFIGTIIGFLLGLFLVARLCLTLPVMAIEQVYNPFAALLRSWRLTAAAKRSVFGFWLMFLIAYTVIFILFSGIGGLVAAIPASETTSSLILGIFTGVFALCSGIVICASAAAMLGQLAPSSAARSAMRGPEA